MVIVFEVIGRSRDCVEEQGLIRGNINRIVLREINMPRNLKERDCCWSGCWSVEKYVDALNDKVD